MRQLCVELLLVLSRIINSRLPRIEDVLVKSPWRNYLIE